LRVAGSNWCHVGNQPEITIHLVMGNSGTYETTKAKHWFLRHPEYPVQRLIPGEISQGIRGHRRRRPDWWPDPPRLQAPIRVPGCAIRRLVWTFIDILATGRIACIAQRFMHCTALHALHCNAGSFRWVQCCNGQGQRTVVGVRRQGRGVWQGAIQSIRTAGLVRRSRGTDGVSWQMLARHVASRQVANSLIVRSVTL
jgi:hypothetical protein